MDVIRTLGAARASGLDLMARPMNRRDMFWRFLGWSRHCRSRCRRSSRAATRRLGALPSPPPMMRSGRRAAPFWWRRWPAWAGRSARTSRSTGAAAAATGRGSRALRTKLIALKPDILLAVGTPSVEELRQRTTTIPIVFAVVTDPVSQGFVQNLAHPGGNVTGFTDYDGPLAGKWLEMLTQVTPQSVAAFSSSTIPPPRRSRP